MLDFAVGGGGFGGRDTSILCLYLGLAAAYSDRPVSIAFDRFEQFQSGVKRHASKVELAMAVDDAGRIAASLDSAARLRARIAVRIGVQKAQHPGLCRFVALDLARRLRLREPDALDARRTHSGKALMKGLIVTLA